MNGSPLASCNLRWWWMGRVNHVGGIAKVLDIQTNKNTHEKPRTKNTYDVTKQ